MTRRAAGALAAGIGILAILGGCGGAEESDGTKACEGELCLDVYRAFFSTEPCEDAPEQSCNYANVFFLLEDGDRNVVGLPESDVAMAINDRKVGVEGAKRLTTSNGLLVSLLLDTSFSITEAEVEDDVRASAKQFVGTLPDEAIVSVARFASEPTVPILVCRDGSEGTQSGSYSSPQDSSQTIDIHYDAYDARTSQSQTKIFDAVARWSRFAPTNKRLRLLQKVMILFTDGTDTASTDFLDAQSTRAEIRDNDEDLKIYAVGLGDDVDVAALETLTDGRVYLAESAEELDQAFDAVSNDLSAIYHLRVLVADVESDARADFALRHDGREIQTSFELDNFGGDDDGDDDDGGSDPGGSSSGPLCE